MPRAARSHRRHLRAPVDLSADAEERRRARRRRATTSAWSRRVTSRGRRMPIGDVRSRRTWPVRRRRLPARRERRSTYWWTGAELSRRARRRRGRRRRSARRCRSSRARSAACTRRSCARSSRDSGRSDLRRHDRRAGGDRRSRAPVAGRRTRSTSRIFTAARRSVPDAPFVDALADARSSGTCCGDAAFLTTSSEAIADAYRERYGVRPSVVHNTFPLPAQAPDFTRADPGRAARSTGSARRSARAAGSKTPSPRSAASGVQRGARRCAAGRTTATSTRCRRLAAAARAAARRSIHQPPAPPDAMVDLARGYDVGLALEHGVAAQPRRCA